MTPEQLQDYAVSLEEQLATKNQELEKVNTSVQELTDLNKALQKRNNDLFMKVEQQPVNEPQQPAEQPKPVQTCEEVARNLYKEIRK